mgnify:CR=1 FL=1
MPVKDVLKTIATLGAGIQTAQHLYNTNMERYRNYQSGKQYVLTLNEGDKLFEQGEKWMLEQVASSKQKSLAAAYRGGKTQVRYVGGATNVTYLEGHKVSFALYREEGSGIEKVSTDLSLTMDELDKKFSPRQLKFRADDEAGRQAVLNLFDQFAQQAALVVAKPTLKVYRWGDWLSTKTLPERSLDTVVLKDGQQERIVADMEKFNNDRERYERIGMPYHRGYLFYGPPGTGKTSLAMALAAHFGQDIAYLSLSDINSDMELTRVISRCTGFLLLEDVDVFSSTVNSRTTDGSKGTTLAGLLNALDGIATPSGLVTIMTTNNIDGLAPALIRSGRIDMKEEIGFLDEPQLGRLFKNIYGDELDIGLPEGLSIAPADMTEIFKRAETPDLAKTLIVDFLENKRG